MITTNGLIIINYLNDLSVFEQLFSLCVIALILNRLSSGTIILKDGEPSGSVSGKSRYDALESVRSGPYVSYHFHVGLV